MIDVYLGVAAICSGLTLLAALLVALYALDDAEMDLERVKCVNRQSKSLSVVQSSSLALEPSSSSTESRNYEQCAEVLEFNPDRRSEHG